ncbi:MAG: hypothetical protein LBC20_16745 [Planctomycetaceae bacterium]|jgi:hypothetical protein|nr:hypothetical protein [Planctomycetaceae bacterium]
MKKITTLLLVIFFLSCLGCSNNVGVSGKITFPDGTPLTVGTVAFTNSAGFFARASIQPDGSYRIGRIKDGDGIPKGTYTIYILDADLIEKPASPTDTPRYIPQVNKKYLSEATSGLSCDVKGKTLFNFQVEQP